MSNDSDYSERLQALVVEALEDRKARDIVVLPVGGVTSITDYMIVASGTSDRHVSSIADGAVEALREHGVKALGVEGAQRGEWVLVDFGDAILHVMQPSVREFYNLEKLWGLDAGMPAAAPDR